MKKTRFLVCTLIFALLLASLASCGAGKTANDVAEGVGDRVAGLEGKVEADYGFAEMEKPSYEVDLELEASFGKTFTEVYVTMKATGNVNVRTEPSSQQGYDTVVAILKPGDRVICVGYGENWNRVLIDGKVYYVSAAYLKVVEE